MAPESVEKVVPTKEKHIEWQDKKDYQPRNNVAPGRKTPVIRNSSEKPGKLCVQLMTWGLVPSWTKLPAGQKYPDHFSA